jgi:hypothetical protein
MEGTVLHEIRYIVDDKGERRAVVLTWEDYETLRSAVSPQSDLLIGLSDSELHALAEGMLSPKHQERLGELLRLNREGQISEREQEDLDQFLAQVDSMNTLRARAKYTLQRRGERGPDRVAERDDSC